MNKVDYAIISAMPEELEFFVDQFSSLPQSESSIREFHFKVYEYKNKKILIASTGIGTTFAASAFTFIHFFFKPDYFLISGTAGAIKKGLKLRDVVIAEKAFEAEMQELFTMI